MHWLAHWLGLDNASGPVYLGLSGFVGDLSLIGAGIAVYRKHNCHRRHCWRLGHFDFTDEQASVTYRLCRKCHPRHSGEHPTRRYIARIHERNGRDLVE